jgi:ATP-dependent helicase/DNAse subunit B
VPLRLIAGPPNSGRAGLILDRLEEVLDRDPVLVVPTREDVDRFEIELDQRGAGFGATILLFNGLFEAAAAATGAGGLLPLTEAQRLGAVRAAIANANLGPLSDSARRAGFAAAAAEVTGDLGAATLDPATVTANAVAAGDRYLDGVASIYAAYHELLAELGRSDAHGLAREATAALRADPGAWGGRPVLLYGFDDLSVEQRELVHALSDAADVTATVTYEDREAFAARAALREELKALGGEVEAELEADPGNTASPLLFHLDRNFLVPGAPRHENGPDSGLVMLEAAGVRGQAEQIGGEVAELLGAGVPPGKIAVALRSAERDGPLYDSVFEGLGIPAATHAELPLASTATGRALLLALRSVRRGAPAQDLVAYLRCPGRAYADQVDWLERTVRRERLATAEQALEAWSGRDLYELDELRRADGEGLLRAAAGLATRIAEYPDERRAAMPGSRRRLELRAGALAARSLAELADAAAEGLPVSGADAAIAALEDLPVPLWEGAAPSRVTISTPYRLRAGRFSHVFVAPLQLGEFPRPGRTDAMLGDDQRVQIGLPKRAEAEQEERYLFAVCLSLPEERLYLCWQGSDEEGMAAVRSPFVEEVTELIEGAPETQRRPLATAALSPADPADLAPRFEAARARTALPGPLTDDVVLAELGGRVLFGASTLEGFRTCSYRWFVSHELGPQPIDPFPEAMMMGSVVHAALEALYGEPPSLEPRPTATTVEAWIERGRELVAAAAREAGLAGPEPGPIALRVRAEQQVVSFVRRDARAETAMLPVAEMMEAGFGEREEDIRPPLEIGGFKLHGKIDRVDIAGAEGAQRALLRDYKTSRSVTPAAKLEETGKLQLQLYSIAVAELWGIAPAGALYEPLGATDSHRPRGIVNAEEVGLIGEVGLFSNDVLAEEEFAAVLDRARELAGEIVERMRAGDIARDPLEQTCPKWCEFAPICRRERARPVPEDDEDDDEDAA